MAKCSEQDCQNTVKLPRGAKCAKCDSCRKLAALLLRLHAAPPGPYQSDAEEQADREARLSKRVSRR